MDYITFVAWTRERIRRIPFIFWVYRFYLVKKNQLYLRPTHLNWGKAHAGSIRKPVLTYLEMHLVTHCNFRCKGCSQFSPIAEKWFANLAEHEKDMKQLSNLFSNIETIRFLGGESLLHPEIEKFLYITRRYFKKTNICIATNGALIPTMSESFWEACKANHIKINWTVYPTLLHKKNEILTKIESKGIVVHAEEVKEFRAILNLKGDSNQYNSFRFCRSLYYCPFLKEGKIYLCSRPLVIKYFNNKFGTLIPEGAHIDIHDPNITGWDILISINKSTDTCKYCATRLDNFEWTETKYAAEEWNVLN
jgi:hypothetical protein